MPDKIRGPEKPNDLKQVEKFLADELYIAEDLLHYWTSPEGKAERDAEDAAAKAEGLFDDEDEEEIEDIKQEVGVDHISEKVANVKKLRQVSDAFKSGDLQTVLDYFEEKIEQERQTSDVGVPKLLKLAKGEFDEHKAGMLERGAAEREKYEQLANIVRRHLTTN